MGCPAFPIFRRYHYYGRLPRNNRKPRYYRHQHNFLLQIVLQHSDPVLCFFCAEAIVVTAAMASTVIKSFVFITINFKIFKMIN
jgi:hypothetical protein